MTPARIRAALGNLPEDEIKRIRDAYYAAVGGLANLQELLASVDSPELAKERTIVAEARTTVARSLLGSVL